METNQNIAVSCRYDILNNVALSIGISCVNDLIPTEATNNELISGFQISLNDEMLSISAFQIRYFILYDIVSPRHFRCKQRHQNQVL